MFWEAFTRVLIVWGSWKFQIFIVDGCWLLLVMFKGILRNRPSFVICLLWITLFPEVIPGSVLEAYPEQGIYESSYHQPNLELSNLEIRELKYVIILFQL